MEQRENLLDILKILLKWLKPISYLCIGVGIGTALLSLLLSDYYESTTIFYAASIDQAKPGQIFGTSNRDIEFYGDDHDNDRLITIAESNELSDYIINKFALYKHYDIDSTSSRAAFRVQEKFNKHYTVIKTKRDAIELSIEDTDKELATEMVNAARDKIDELAIVIVKNQLQKLKQTLEKNIEGKDKKLEALGDSIQIMKDKFGVYSTETQGEILASEILKAETQLAKAEARYAALQRNKAISRDTLVFLAANISGYKSEVNLLKKNIANYNEGLSTVLLLERQQRNMANKLGVEKVNLNQLITAYNSDISAINLIEAGQIPIIKSRPKRSLIVVSAIIVTFTFSFIGVLLFESYKDVSWKELTT